MNPLIQRENTFPKGLIHRSLVYFQYYLTFDEFFSDLRILVYHYGGWQRENVCKMIVECIYDHFKRNSHTYQGRQRYILIELLMFTGHCLQYTSPLHLHIVLQFLVKSVLTQASPLCSTPCEGHLYMAIPFFATFYIFTDYLYFFIFSDFSDPPHVSWDQRACLHLHDKLPGIIQHLHGINVSNLRVVV